MAKISSVAVIVGSLRKESFNRKIAKALIGLAPDSLKLEIVEIAPLQMYNQDLDPTPTAEWTAFRERIKKADAILFVTPEYNRSMPAVLKNAVDVGSRPYGHSVWNAKPCAIVSTSPGGTGGFGSNHHLRQSLVFLNMPAMPAPEAYLGHIDKSLDDAGNVTNDDTRKYLQRFITAFADWVAVHVRG